MRREESEGRERIKKWGETHGIQSSEQFERVILRLTAPMAELMRRGSAESRRAFQRESGWKAILCQAG